ncbi:hypothetical protein A0U92_13550 [Acetobacter aceti]|uniref:Transposase IS4-like domain-containing protein n=1 Tax=Acetobacter aceti TaxID=435 RepID=A0A1U9KIS2_ACEAC|nr:hypothetical protein A0U92_13550 [Acetobacter aceti]
MPSVGIIDSRSFETAGNGGPRGYDARKKIWGRKRHIATDTLGHIVVAAGYIPPTFRFVMARRLNLADG